MNSVTVAVYLLITSLKVGDTLLVSDFSVATHHDRDLKTALTLCTTIAESLNMAHGVELQSMYKCKIMKSRKYFDQITINQTPDNFELPIN